VDIITVYWKEILMLLSLAYNAATIIARITPTPKDDKIVNELGKLLNFILLKSRIK